MIFGPDHANFGKVQTYESFMQLCGEDKFGVVKIALCLEFIFFVIQVSDVLSGTIRLSHKGSPNHLQFAFAHFLCRLTCSQHTSTVHDLE